MLVIVDLGTARGMPERCLAGRRSWRMVSVGRGVWWYKDPSASLALTQLRHSRLDRYLNDLSRTYTAIDHDCPGAKEGLASAGH